MNEAGIRGWQGTKAESDDYKANIRVGESR